MVENTSIITGDKAKEIAEKYLLAKYFDAKLNASGSDLVILDGIQTYQVRGQITMRSRSQLDRFTITKNANKYGFLVEVDAQQGQVTNYEII